MFSIMNGSLGSHNSQFGWALNFSTSLWIYLRLRFSSGILFQATILLVLKCGYCCVVCCNPILCIWWMLKFLLLVPHLQREFTSLQVQLVIHRKFYMPFSALSFLKWWTCWICEISFSKSSILCVGKCIDQF